MLSDEEKKAIEKIKEELIEPFYNFPNPTSIELKDTKVELLETVLNLIEKQDKIINEMAEIIEECRQNDCLDVSNLDFGEIAGTEKIIKYFEKKVEEN